MRRLPARFMPHRDLISYKPKTGDGTYGPVYGEEVICKRGAISDKRRYVRDRDGKISDPMADLVVDNLGWVV